MKLYSLMAVCLSALLSVNAFAGSAAAGKQKATTCQACHGADGNSQSPEFPKLAGQYQDYIIHALHAYKNGTRKNPIMKGFAANLSDADIADLAAYFSSQKDVLYTKE